MEEKKRNHLTLEVKYFIVQEEARKPRKSITDFIYAVNIKYGIKSSEGTIHRVT